MYKIIIGIDPGAQGAITWAKVKDNKLTMWPEVVPMPKTFEEMNHFFMELGADLSRIICFIEKVNVRPSDMHGGKAFGMMKLVKNFDRLKDAMKINNVGYIEVHPATWQNFLGLKLPKGQEEEKKDRKNRYKKVAQSQYPKIRCTLKNCDALLLMTFGLRKLNEDIQYIMNNIPDVDRDLLF